MTVSKIFLWLHRFSYCCEGHKVYTVFYHQQNVRSLPKDAHSSGGKIQYDQILCKLKKAQDK